MDHVLPWLTLKSVPGIGNLLFKNLVSQLGSPQAVLAAPKGALLQIDGVSPRLAEVIRRHRTPDWVRRELDLIHEKGYAIITQHDPRYPALLQHIPDPPPLLYVKGRLAPEASHIAVVGSRRATGYGRHTTLHLSKALARHGVIVVSGMARGIDTAAHQGALNGGGPTVAVLGTGLDNVYPAENLKLFHQIAENGAVISEFPLDAGPAPHHFPIRNRIISGMTLGTVVVEAAKRSGSLITARLAAEQGREVFAVPGSIQACTTQGTHELIRQGAKLVERVEDILEELGPQLAMPRQDAPAVTSGDTQRPLPVLSTAEKEVFNAVGPYAVHIDELVRQLNLDSAHLSAILMQLELKGVICQEPGKFFVRHRAFNAL